MEHKQFPSDPNPQLQAPFLRDILPAKVPLRGLSVATLGISVMVMIAHHIVVKTITTDTWSMELQFIKNMMPAFHFLTRVRCIMGMKRSYGTHLEQIEKLIFCTVGIQHLVDPTGNRSMFTTGDLGEHPLIHWTRVGPRDHRGHTDGRRTPLASPSIGR